VCKENLEISKLYWNIKILKNTKKNEFLVQNVETPVYAFADLISEIGGTVGLFLGFSLVQLAFLIKRGASKGARELHNVLQGRYGGRKPKEYSIETIQNNNAYSEKTISNNFFLNKFFS